MSHLIEFPADDPERALRFWRGLLGVELTPRGAAAGEGWEADEGGLRFGVHERGTGPGDTGSLPYFTIEDMAVALERVGDLAGPSAATRRAVPSRWPHRRRPRRASESFSVSASWSGCSARRLSARRSE